MVRYAHQVDNPAFGGTVDFSQVTSLPGLKIERTVAGQYRLDDGSVRGWGIIGPVDDSNTQSWGTHTATTINRSMGGYVFPYAVNLLELYAVHTNQNNDAEAWGWVIGRQTKTFDTAGVTSSFILHETQENGNVGPRDYGNTFAQETDLDLSARPEAQNIPAGTIIGLAVSLPTSPGTQRFVRINSGYMTFERA